MIGFETIGNATITIFDDKPVLTTDPWIRVNHILVVGHMLMTYQKIK